MVKLLELVQLVKKVALMKKVSQVKKVTLVKICLFHLLGAGVPFLADYLTFSLYLRIWSSIDSFLKYYFLSLELKPLSLVVRWVF